ncbi:MAG: ribosomal protein S18-alanine N-acetyltransferase [Sterolibacterium sp.]|nr:ribosomal protein S18-alanine N-acetyltransferase [Sterolibacterium sp.]
MQDDADIDFRPMQLIDVDAVCAIEQRAQVAPWTRAQFIDSLAAGHAAWLLYRGTVLSGYALCSFVLDEAELLDIVIDPACQRQGLAGRFMAFLAREARQAGAQKMFLEVRVSNRAAQALYARSGFSPVGLRRDYYPCAAGREHALLMMRLL